MMESVRAESRDRARSTQIGIACELRWKLDGAVPELTMDGGPRIRAGLGDPGFSDLHHPAFCNPLPAARDGPLTDGAAALGEQRNAQWRYRPVVRGHSATGRSDAPDDQAGGMVLARASAGAGQVDIASRPDRPVPPPPAPTRVPGIIKAHGVRSIPV
jgi:hypothetical protein